MRGRQGEDHDPLFAGSAGAGERPESGSVVRESFWIDCADKQTAFEIPIKAEWLPNVYASVTLVQPHNHTHNDAPIRLFGVIRLDVEDAARSSIR